jgi:hypothetical protein
MKSISLSIFLMLCCLFGYAQNYRQQLAQDVRFQVDTAVFFSGTHHTLYQSKTYYTVRLSNPNDLVTVSFLLQDSVSEQDNCHLHDNESLVFKDLSAQTSSSQKEVKFSFSLQEGKPFFRGNIVVERQETVERKKQLWVIPVFVYCETSLEVPSEIYHVFQEEDVFVELPGVNVWNIQADHTWRSSNEVDYRFTRQSNSIKIQLRAHLTGSQTVTIPFVSNSPVLQANNTIGQVLEEIEISLKVKPNQIEFLPFDVEEVFFDLKSLQNGQVVQMKNSTALLLKKTYRIEDQQDPGGNLIAELFTRSVMSNGKVLCWLRPFGLHSVSEGYLFIKDGDRTRFVTNLNILEKPRIDQILVMRKNEDWSDKLYGRPGEKLDVKVLGKGLSKTKVQLPDMSNLKRDSISQSDEVAFYQLTIPQDVSKSKYSFFMNNQVTAFDLMVKEFQEPRNLDFVSLRYGDEAALLTDEKLEKPVLYEKLLKDVSFSFDVDKIDKGQSLYGKQYLDIEIRVVSPRGELKETIHKQVVVCPGEKSIRFDDYDRSDCENSVVSLNDLLNTKTYNLEGYSQIFITVRHDPKNYATAGYKRSVKIILKRNVVFDLQVSFPAGMLIKRFDTEGLGSLSGISIAAIAQLSFYDQLQIGKIKPYRIGAGFLALNAFNFSDNADVQRDVAIVAMASVYPINRSSKFSFPLHTGFGYMMKQGAWFFLFGPGIEVKF